MLCPRCNGSLFANSKDGVEIEVCTDCGGIWLDANELKVLAEQAKSDGNIAKAGVVEEVAVGVQSTQENVDMKCPKCSGATLTAFIYAFDSGIELDRCPQCSGLWLDKSELEQIVSYMVKADNCPMADALNTRSDEEGFLARHSGVLKYIGKFLMQNAKYRYR